MPDDRVSQLSIGIAVILAAHGAAAWAGLVPGKPWANFIGAAVVAGIVMFRR